jgi:16S rRNA (cytosine967-C5)-methyltransferase
MLEIQRHAARVVGRVLAGRSLDAELRATWQRASSLSAADRAALQDIAFGTLRFLGQIDAALDALLERPLESDRLRDLLRIALFQLIHTRAAAHAVVDHAVRSADALGHTRARGLVNAVLRSFLRKRDTVLHEAARTDVGRYSHPQWWIDKLVRGYPHDHVRILESANMHPPLTLRVNRRRVRLDAYRAMLDEAELAHEIIGEAALTLIRAVPVDRIPGFAEGLASVQDASAQRAALLLDLHDGLNVLDACAAPGGKTAHILECADVDLTAVDQDAARLDRVQANLTRLGLNARLVCGDARTPQTWWDGRAFARILADVPCSASGVVRRHPDIKWLRRAEDTAAFAERQRELLDALWQLLGSDGKLLYATCSVFHEENEEQIARFLERHHDARRLSLPGLNSNPQVPAGQILPDATHDGFFYALLEKTRALSLP